MTDAEIITQLRTFHGMKGWPVLREAADRLERLNALHGHEPLCPACRDTFGDCNTCGGTF